MIHYTNPFTKDDAPTYTFFLTRDEAEAHIQKVRHKYFSVVLLTSGAWVEALPRDEEARKKHKIPRSTHHPLYPTWEGINSLCYNPNHPSFPLYGGRGVEVLFRDFTEFATFMGERPKGKTLCRYDMDGHYSPFNCYWGQRPARRASRNIAPHATPVGMETMVDIQAVLEEAEARSVAHGPGSDHDPDQSTPKEPLPYPRGA